MTYSLVTREGKGSKLTITEMDGNLLYLQQLAQSNGATGPAGPAGSNNVVFLTYENSNNTTISSTASIIFASNDSGYEYLNLTLPTPTIGWQMTIVRTDQYNSENGIIINGSFFSGDSNYSLSYSGTNVVIIFDGSVWHVLSGNND